MSAFQTTTPALKENDNHKLSFAEVMKISFGMITLEEVQELVARLNKVVIDVADGLTLLHIAAQFGRCELIEFLCGEKNHPTEVKTIHGETPLDQAAWKGFVDASLLLIKYGADVDCQTFGGYTPLHRCAFYKHRRLAGLFCLAGADQTIRDENNQTAYEVAVETKHDKIAAILKPIEGIPEGIYARNNPKHPEFRPEARESLFRLAEMEAGMGGDEESPHEDEGESPHEDEGDGFDDEDDDDDDDDDDENLAEEKEFGSDEVDVEFDEDNSDVEKEK